MTDRRDPRPGDAEPDQALPPGQHWTDELMLLPEQRTAGIPRSAEPGRPVATWLVVLAVALSATAVGLAARWQQHRSRVVEVVHEVRPYLPAGPDPGGCPSGSRCQVRSDLSQPLSMLARRLFPDATVLTSVSVTSLSTGRPVQTSIVLQTPSGVRVSATAQCVPGAAPIPSRAAALPPVGPAQADFVMPGRPGCSVAVAAQVPRAVPVPATLLEQLAGDRQVQLSP